MAYTPRTITDQSVQNPYRYQLVDVNTNAVIGTYDIVKTAEPGDIEGTKIDAAYLQPIEDFLKEISDDLAALGVQIVSVNTALTTAATAANARIDQSNANVTAINNSLASYAPLNAPTLTNPSANIVAIATNSTALATTAAVKTYLDGLMSAYRG